MKITRQEKIKHFLQTYKGTGNIREAAAETGDLADIIDFLSPWAEVETGDTAILGDFINRQETSDRKRKEKQIAAELETKAGALKSETEPEKRQGIIKDMGRGLAELETIKRKSPIVSYEEYRTRRTDRKYWEEFAPVLFNRLPFPDGSINLIGARSGAGKTNALINLMRELLTTEMPQPVTTNKHKEQAKNAARRMIFVSREMTIDDILDRLTLSLAWSIRDDFQGTIENIKENAFFNLQCYHTSKKYPDKMPDQSFLVYDHVLDNIINPAMKSGRLVMLDAIEAESLEEILLNLARINTGPGDVILIDYVQLLPATTNEEAERYATADHLRMRYIVHELRKAAKNSGAIFICAAQLNREAAKNQAEGKANIETAFKDSADLEQAAHSAVIINRKDGDGETPAELSYHVVKARSSYHLGQHYLINWEPSFYHLTLGNIAPKKKSKKQQSPNEAGSKADKVLGRD